MYDRVRYTNNQDFLKKICHKAQTLDVKKLAIGKIKDQNFLYQFIVSNRNLDLRLAAAKNITNDNLRLEVIKNANYDADIFCLFLDTISQEPEIIADYLENSSSSRVWEAGLPLIRSRNILEKLKKIYSDKSKKTDRQHISTRSVDIINRLDRRLEEIPSSIDFIFS
jgi:hypothetical protein